MKAATRLSACSSVLTLVIGAALGASPAVGASTAEPTAASTAAKPAGTLTSALSPAGATRTRRVTLLTGDRVTVLTDASGHVMASLTRQSPHHGEPIQTFTANAHTYVIPRLAPSLRRRLDPSVFDVAALDTRSGQVPLEVTFSQGTTPHSLAGMQVRASTARSTRGGHITARASYDASQPLSRVQLASLRGVTRIAVRGARPAAAPGYELHTLTIDATSVAGAPVGSQYAIVFNADDARLFFAVGAIVDGEWKVSVPSGHYVMVTDDSKRVVLHQATVADTDRSTSFSMAEATAKPDIVYPHHSELDPQLSIGGRDEAGTLAWSSSFLGFLRVSPVADIAAGTLFTNVRQTWGPKGYQPYTKRGAGPRGSMNAHPITHVALGLKSLDGIPAGLTFRYSDTDFAQADIRHHATGAKQNSLDTWAGFKDNVEDAVLLNPLPTVRPGVVHAKFEASKHIVWDTLAAATVPFFSKFTYLEEAAVIHGDHASESFFRAPVTPVADRGDESGRLGNWGDPGGVCSLCVEEGRLRGELAMFSSAGTKQSGANQDATWALFHRRTRLGHGGPAFAMDNLQVRPGERLRMVATTGAPNTAFVLSSHVRDEWRFSAPKNAVVPILRADYVPPTNLKSFGARGKVSFPITFDNLGPVDARVRHAAVKWSTDGQRWHAASLRRKDPNTFRVSYANPTATTHKHRYLSLKVFAKDTAGRSISENVQHAYLLPKATTRAGHTMVHGTVRGAHDTFHPEKLCRTPRLRKHRYSCFVRLEPVHRDARSTSPAPTVWGAKELRSAYALGPDQSASTVAVIVVGGYPHAEADMNHYRKKFRLAACTSATGCFRKLNQVGEAGNYPRTDQDWGVESALDVQMISAACPTCNIVLVEANKPTDRALRIAEQTAVNAGATVTNHSYGRMELTGTDAQAGVYDHPGVSAVAASGDFGYQPASFPASSPAVVAVGGTTLARSTTDPRGWTEKAWQHAGSGCSAYFAKPAGQPDTACHGRTIADVSAVSQDLLIYDTSLPKAYAGFLRVAGTSASSPLVAGMIASGGHGGLRPNDLYAAAPGGFNDVVKGTNGYCLGSYICTALTGYDGPTGLGTPNGAQAFP